MNSPSHQIYLVDDSRSIRTFFTNALQSHGYIVQAFDNPLPCIETLKEKSPDCILTDYEMPNMNGVDFCRHIKSDETTRGVPVILLSNHDDDARIIEALNAGADDYLPKSTNPEIILGKIKLMTELKKHREKTLAQERLRTYKATICRIGHDLNNIMAILIPLLQSNENMLAKHGEVVAEPFRRLHKNLVRLAGNIKAITSQVEHQIEFETYSYETEMVTLKKAE
jgi:DNA-binding response OmpR family regulator